MSISIPSVDEEAWQKLEAGTAHSLNRLRALKTLVDAGIEAGVLIAPIVPGISSHPRKLDSTLRAIADHGAAFIGSCLQHLEGGTRTHFLNVLRTEHPILVESYGRLYAGKYAAPQYAWPGSFRTWHPQGTTPNRASTFNAASQGNRGSENVHTAKAFTIPTENTCTSRLILLTDQSRVRRSYAIFRCVLKRVLKPSLVDCLVKMASSRRRASATKSDRRPPLNTPTLTVAPRPTSPSLVCSQQYR